MQTLTEETKREVYSKHFASMTDWHESFYLRDVTDEVLEAVAEKMQETNSIDNVEETLSDIWHEKLERLVMTYSEQVEAVKLNYHLSDQSAITEIKNLSDLAQVNVYAMYENEGHRANSAIKELLNLND
jgi:hypothetical protein